MIRHSLVENSRESFALPWVRNRPIARLPMVQSALLCFLPGCDWRVALALGAEAGAQPVRAPPRPATPEWPSRSECAACRFDPGPGHQSLQPLVHQRIATVQACAGIVVAPFPPLFSPRRLVSFARRAPTDKTAPAPTRTMAGTDLMRHEFARRKAPHPRLAGARGVHGWVRCPYLAGP